MEKYRLAVDLGTNSIGWAALKLRDGTPAGILKMGVRIFSDGRNPKDQTTLASARRLARQMRRQRDRKLQRRKLILNTLCRMGLFPYEKAEREKLKKLDVLRLRSMAARGEELAPYELGRVFLHLSKRRGFQSSRKETKEARDNKLTAAMSALKEQLSSENAITYGDFLYQRMLKGLSTAATVEAGFYPARDVVKSEFDEIVEKQKKLHPDVTAQQWQALRDKIFYQRPLRPVEVGKCSLYGEESRAYQYSPSFEQYRLLTELFNLRIINDDHSETELSYEQIERCFNELQLKKEIKYSDVKKVLRLDSSVQFSIEANTKKEKFKGCPVAYFFGSKRSVLGAKWAELTLEQRDQLAEAYFESGDQDLNDNLQKLGFLDDEQIRKLSESEVPIFSDVTAAFSTKALREIVKRTLEERNSPLSILSKLRRGEGEVILSSELGYYGKEIPESVIPIPQHILRHGRSINEDEKNWGKIANPTVHIGLNQLRKVVNELVRELGKPESIHIEFTRDLKLSKARKESLAAQNKRNEELNKKAREFIEERGLKATAFQMEKVKLWFEMERFQCECVYTGQKISQDMILTEKVEVDHILPFSRTLDDSFSNKVLVTAEANRIKKNRTPYEAFGKNDPVQWAAILDRVAQFPWAKRKRFSPQAMVDFEKNSGFLARQLTDTSYLAKIAKKYLATLIPQSQIVVLPGRLTALVRGKLGLNSILSEGNQKNRTDHRHHVIDAVVIGIVDRSLLLKMSNASEEGRGRISVPEPWDDFRNSVQSSIHNVVVSHKVDHSPFAAFVSQTGFGLREPQTPHQIKNDFKMVTSWGLDKFKTEKHFSSIVSDQLRSIALSEGIEGLVKAGVRKSVRVYQANSENFKDIGGLGSYVVKVTHGPQGEHYVCYEKDGTHKVTVWKVPYRKDSKEYAKGETHYLDFVFHYYFDSMQRPEAKKPHPSAKFIMEIYRGDTVEMNIDAKRNLYRVVTMSPSKNQIGFELLHDTKGQKSKSFFRKSSRKLKTLNFRKMKVTPAGKILPGPRL